MLTKSNFEGTKAALKEYLAKCDYSKPFIIAGNSRFGKTAIVEQLLGRKCFVSSQPLSIDTIQNELNSTKADYLIYHIWDSKDAIKYSEGIAKICTVGLSSNIPVIIEVSCDSLECLNEMDRLGCKVNVLTFDADEWFKWGYEINPQTGKTNVNTKVLDFLSDKPLSYINFILGDCDANKGGSCFTNQKRWLEFGKQLDKGERNPLTNLPSEIVDEFEEWLKQQNAQE